LWDGLCNQWNANQKVLQTIVLKKKAGFKKEMRKKKKREKEKKSLGHVREDKRR